MRSIKPCTIDSRIYLLCTQAIKVKGKKTLQQPKGKHRLYSKEIKTMRSNNSVCERCFSEKVHLILSSFGEKKGTPKMFLGQNLLSLAWHIFLWNILPRSDFAKAGGFPGSLAGKSGPFPSALPWIAACLVPCTTRKGKTWSTS